jgi:hypothetical protein
MLSQFMSRVVVPPDTPKTLVCIAALTPVWQTSELLTTIDGLDAVGGVLSTTVLDETVALVTVSAARNTSVVTRKMMAVARNDSAAAKVLYAIVGTFLFRGCG